MKVKNLDDIDIVFYGIDKYTVDELLAINHTANAFAWCDGFLFGISHIEGQLFTKLLIEKRQRTFAGLDYAEMPKYDSKITTKSNVEIYIVDHSNTKFFQDVAKYLKGKN